MLRLGMDKSLDFAQLRNREGYADRHLLTGRIPNATTRVRKRGGSFGLEFSEIGRFDVTTRSLSNSSVRYRFVDNPGSSCRISYIWDCRQ